MYLLKLTFLLHSFTKNMVRSFPGSCEGLEPSSDSLKPFKRFAATEANKLPTDEDEGRFWELCKEPKNLPRLEPAWAIVATEWCQGFWCHCTLFFCPNLQTMSCYTMTPTIRYYRYSIAAIIWGGDYVWCQRLSLPWVLAWAKAEAAVSLQRKLSLYGAKIAFLPFPHYNRSCSGCRSW